MARQVRTFLSIHSLLGYLFLLASISTSRQGTLADSPRIESDSDTAALHFRPASETFSVTDTLPRVTLRNTDSVSNADVASSVALLHIPAMNQNPETRDSHRLPERNIRDPDSCVNTVQGKYLVSDNRGYVCSRKEVNAFTRCCPTIGSPFQCSNCNQTSQCCSVYEFCVSCCLHPDITTPETALAVLKGKQHSSKTYSSVFDYCKGRCRHNSHSVIHENTYISKNHHCFAPPPPVQDTGTVSVESDEDSLEGVIVSVGMVGLSCESVCGNAAHEGVPRQCVVSKFKALNKCEVLHKYFACRGFCVGSMGPDQPAEVSDSAPRHLMPGACLFNTRLESSSCEGSHPNTRRLCPCK